MLRRYGLLAGMICGMLLLTSLSFAGDVSVFNRQSQDLEYKYGFQIIGGAGTYLMDDVNDYRVQSNQHSAIGNSEDASLGFSFGLAILYRSHENFRWTFGYSKLGYDRAYSDWQVDGVSGQNKTVDYEQVVSGNEYYVMGSYIWNLGDTMHLHLGAGPAIYSATLDRTYSESGTEGGTFRDANGRSVGFRSMLGLEWLFSETLGLHVGAGFRYAYVYKLAYDDVNGAEQVVYSGENKMAADFTGAFAEIGLRMYFKPTTNWWKL